LLGYKPRFFWSITTRPAITTAKRWKTSAIFHDWHLADPHDALYNAASSWNDRG
jgi:hypothetical protein